MDTSGLKPVARLIASQSSATLWWLEAVTTVKGSESAMLWGDEDD